MYYPKIITGERIVEKIIQGDALKKEKVFEGASGGVAMNALGRGLYMAKGVYGCFSIFYDPDFVGNGHQISVAGSSGKQCFISEFGNDHVLRITNASGSVANVYLIERVM